MQRWETAARYYCAGMYQDLLGDWVVACAWGGRRNNLGNISIHPVADPDEGRAVLAAIATRRRQRHYCAAGSS